MDPEERLNKLRAECTNDTAILLDVGTILESEMALHVGSLLELDKVTLATLHIIQNCASFSATGKQDAAQRIIEEHELPITQQEILDAFKIITLAYDIPNNTLKTLISESYGSNKNMFIALILAINKSHVSPDNVYNLVGVSDSYGKVIGISGYGAKINAEVGLYCKLLDNYEFSVDDVQIHTTCKMVIKQYAIDKYGGKLTKPAINKK